MFTRLGTLFNDLMRSDLAVAMFGLAGNDDLNGSSARDLLYGGQDDDVIQGGAGHDLIDTGTGAYDRATGGEGNDEIISAADVAYLYGGQGRDVLTASGNGYHYLSGDEGNDFLTGGTGDDWLSGGRGDDTLYGGLGNNQLYGGKGDDKLFGMEGYSQLDGGAGDDLLQSNIAAVTRIDGGADFDTAQIDAAGIWVDIGFEFDAKGSDVLVNGVEVARIRDVERFVFDGGHANDSLSFTSGNDIAWGNDGNDTLKGNTGFDQLFGGEGADVLNGGTGGDDLTGGAGADRFVYRTPSDSQAALVPAVQAQAGSTLGTGVDTIFDFSRLEGDRIDLSAIDADTGQLLNQAFTFIGTDPFSALGQVRYSLTAAGDTLVEANNRDGLAAELMIVLKGSSLQLLEADFIL